ncbi:Cytochrome P450, partial [Dillenia turbinata]
MAIISILQPYMEGFLRTPMFNPLVLFTVLMFSLLLVKLIKSSKYNLPPSPPRLPLIGNLHQLGSLPHHSLRTLSENYGRLLRIHMGKSTAVVVSSTELVREIMKTQDTIFANRQKTIVADVMIGWNSGECVSELLSRRRLQQLHYIKEREVKVMIAKLQESCINEKVAVNLGEIFFNFFIKTLYEFAFGGESGGEEFCKQFTRILLNISELLQSFSFREIFPLISWKDKFTGLHAKLKGTFKETDAFLDRVIKEHEYRMKSKNEQFEEKDCVDVLFVLKTVPCSISPWTTSRGSL